MVVLISALATGLSLLSVAYAEQRVFSSTERTHSLASSVSKDAHTTFKHPSFPSHGLRIKETTGWCDPNVRSYAGVSVVSTVSSAAC